LRIGRSDRLRRGVGQTLELLSFQETPGGEALALGFHEAEYAILAQALEEWRIGGCVAGLDYGAAQSDPLVEEGGGECFLDRAAVMLGDPWQEGRFVEEVRRGV
jgi:hypothetical protein